MIHAFVKINDVQLRLANDNLNSFDQSWGKTLMALVKASEGDLLESLLTIDSERSPLSCRLPWRSIVPMKFTAKSWKSYSRLKALVSDVLQDEQQKFSLVSEGNRSCESPSVSSPTCEKNKGEEKGGDCKQWS